MTVSHTLRIALIDGPTYAPLYDLIPAFTAQTGIDVEIVVRLPHAALNDVVIDRDDPEWSSFDLISTHIKYAPSQAAALLPLDELLNENELTAFLPAPLAQCRVEGRLLQLPRHTDTRLLVYRRDWFENAENRRRFAGIYGRSLSVPATWDELQEVAAFFTAPPVRYGFAFTGQPSGLFGTFYELLCMAGGTLFDAEGRPDLISEAAQWSLGYLYQLHVVRRVTPTDTLDWDFSDVTAAFMNGSVAMIADWPGSFGLIADPRRSTVADRFDVDLYPTGPAGLRCVYSGSHSFAITRSCRDVPAAVELLRALTSPEAQLMEARMGAVPTRQDVAVMLRAETTSEQERHRQSLLTETIATSMISFPPLATYPILEEIASPLLASALHGERSIEDALASAQQQITAAGIGIEMRP